MNGNYGEFMIGAALPAQWLEDDGFALHVAQVRALKHNAALVSLPWAQIEPEAGQFDASAIDCCIGALERLRSAAVEPVCILCDGTAPHWFEARGGWSHSNAAESFRAYAAHVAQLLSPQCSCWVPLAEPEYALAWKYHEGGPLGYRRASVQMVRAHRAATAALRAVRPDARVGFSVRVFSAEPADIDSPWDFHASRRLEHRLNHRMVNRVRETGGENAFDFVLASWGGVVSAWFSPWQWRREWVLTLDKNRARISLQDAHRGLARFDEAMSALLGYQTPLLVVGEGGQPLALHDQLRAVAQRRAEDGGDRVMGFLLGGPLDTEDWESYAGLWAILRDARESWPRDTDE